MAPFATDAATLINRLVPLLAAAGRPMGRPAGAAIVLPIFPRAQLGAPGRAAIAFAVAVAAIPAIDRQLAATPMAPGLLVLMATKEVFVGLIIGVLMGVPIWSVQSAGELLDTQRSATQDRQSEPDSGNQDSTTAVFLGITVIALFVMSGGLRALAQTIYGSYLVWPALRFMPLPTRGWDGFLLGLLDHISAVSLAVAAPVILGMLLCEAGVILLMRAIPKLHVYDLAPTLRNVMFVVMMFAYADWLVFYMQGEVEHLRGTAAALSRLLR